MAKRRFSGLRLNCFARRIRTLESSSTQSSTAPSTVTRNDS
jgi:hypothetical protein